METETFFFCSLCSCYCCWPSQLVHNFPTILKITVESRFSIAPDFFKPSITRSDHLVPLTIECHNKLGGIYPHSYISRTSFRFSGRFEKSRIHRINISFICHFSFFHGLHCDSHGSHPGSHGSHPGSHDSHASHCDSHGSLARALVRLLTELIKHDSAHIVGGSS